MNNQLNEFLEFMIAERMQMLCSNEPASSNQEELEQFTQLETACKKAISSLSEADKNAIESYYDFIVTQITDQNTFFYKQGFSDGFDFSRSFDCSYEDFRTLLKKFNTAK